MTSVIQAIRDKLNAALVPQALDVFDESARHAGHSGARPGGETHFRIIIVSPAFRGLSRVARQRAVYAALSEEIAAGVHAIALTTLTPEEMGSR